MKINEIIESLKSKLLKGQNQKLAKETVWALIAKGSSSVFFYLFTIVLARNLTVEEFGNWSYFYSILTIIFTVSYLGLNYSAGRFVAEKKGENVLDAVLRQSFWMKLLSSLIFCLIFFVGLKFTNIVSDVELQGMLIKSIPIIILSGMTEYFKHVFEGLHRLKYNFVVGVIEFGLKLGFVLLFFAISDKSINSIILSFNMSLMASAVVGLIILLVKFYRKTDSKERYELDILKYAVPSLILTLTAILFTEVDNIMLKSMQNSYEVGIYSGAMQLVTKFPQLSLAIAMGTTPIFAKINEDNRLVLKETFKKILSLNTIIFTALVVVMFATSWWFIPVLMGEGYQASVLIFNILLIYVWFASASRILSSVIHYAGYAKRRSWYFMISFVLKIGLNFLLLPKYGALGAAISTTISYIPFVVLSYLFLQRIFSGKVKS